MGRIFYGILAVVASFVLVESLTCNTCSFSLFGVCLNSADETCSNNTNVCYTGTASFPSLSSFLGFKTQGCKEPAGCNATTNGTMLGATYQVKIECCSTDKCNSGAPSTKLSLTAAIGAAVMASVWGSALY